MSELGSKLVLSRAVILPSRQPHALILRPIVEWAVALSWLAVLFADYGMWPWAVMVSIGAFVMWNGWWRR